MDAMRDEGGDAGLRRRVIEQAWPAALTQPEFSGLPFHNHCQRRGKLSRDQF